MVTSAEKRASNMRYSKTATGKASQARAQKRYKEKKKNGGVPLDTWCASPTLLVNAMNTWR